MRIIAGQYRSRQLCTPQGKSTRPTLDKVREAVFTMLMAYLMEANFLDLYAGSGANGLEALSRGAKRAVFVDQSIKAKQAIISNIKNLELTEKTQLLTCSVKKAINELLHEKFDLVYIDPPYKVQENENIVRLLITKNLINDQALIVIEADKNDIYPLKIGYMKLIKKKVYGISQILFYQKESI